MPQNDYDLVIGRNPVKEALRGARNINKILVAKGVSDYSLGEITAAARAKGINVQTTDRRKLDAMTQNGMHQGVVAYCSPIVFSEVSDILRIAEARKEKPFVVILDQITDPHNAGAIIRSAYAAGAHGIIIPKRRSASVNSTVYRASAGSIEHIAVAQVSNIAQTIDVLKKQGLFAVCADSSGTKYYEIDYDMPLMLIIGSEGAGAGTLIKKKCDFTAGIPMKGTLDSLNASVAAGIIMFEILRNRG